MSKVLIAMHGYEPQGWADDVVRALPSTDTSLVRVLVVLDTPSPPFTSLIPAAGRRYVLRRGRSPEVVHALARAVDPGRAIVEHARAWGAEVIIIGRDMRSRLSRALLAAAHERVVNDAPCPVLVTPAERGARAAALVLERPDLGQRSPAALQGGA